MTGDVFRGMAPQRRTEGDEAGARTRLAMQLGAAMADANREVERPPLGVEVAERAALATRSYAMEWQRLMTTPREDWR